MDITLMNIDKVSPEELLDYMHLNYDDVILCKEGGLDVNDLATIQGFIGWCQNVESFLNPLIAKMDIISRSIPADKKAGSAYQLAMSKKFILNQYYNHIERLFKTLSRQVSIYSEMTHEYMMDRRADNIAQFNPEENSWPTAL